jgi:two-component sensor histidine kinase
MSLFSLESANSCGGLACQDHLERLSNRVASISGLYSMLGASRRDRSIELKPYLSGIVSAIETGFLQDRRGIGISGVFEDIVVDAEKAAAIALIANELVTNSIKYAFVGRSEGMVRIELKRDRDELRLLVSDDGIGLPADFSPEDNSGLGLRLASLLAEQHKGHLSWQGEGRRNVELSLPM